MSREVWKYKLNMGKTKVVLPEGSILAHIGVQNGCIYIWVEQQIEPADGIEHIYFVVGTGQPLPEGYAHMDHRGSVFQGPFVWHVYEGW